MKTIFVQIASYRDPECQWTVKDLFAKATHPERIHVGICWQYDPVSDKDCFQINENEQQVRFNPFHWQESQGVCWARHQAQQLYDGEDYILSIDSHMRFAPGWDELMIAQLKECPSKKPVLSNHPAAYTPPDNLHSDATPTILRAHLYSPQGDIRIRGVNLDRAPKKPLRGAFCAGGFIFSSKEFILEVPYDPYLYFDQEEISLSARLFTHGFDIHSPKDIMIYHYYRHATNPDAAQPRLQWEDNPNWLKFQERARKRFNHLIGHTPSENPIIVGEIEKYNLGTARSLDEYQAFCGINFKNRTVSEVALRAGFIEGLEKYLDKPIHIPEIDDVPKVMVEAPAPVKPESGFVPFDQPAAIERLIGFYPKNRAPNVDREAPEGVMIIYDYIDRKTCEKLKKYADAQAFTELAVVDPHKSTNETIVTLKDEGRITHHVDIDGMAPDIIDLFNDIYCRQCAAFYNVSFEWFERPQILRYPAGGRYNKHADSDHWQADTDTWLRVQDRDYSVLLYLNDDYEGGELELVEQDYRIKPKPGMLLAFPSDHRYLHAALPTTSGIRYAIVSWAAIMGSRRVRKQMPYASIYIRQKRTA